MSEIINFPIVKKFTGSTQDILDQAKGWDFESVVIIGFEKNSQSTMLINSDDDKRSYLEMSELLRVMYLMQKGWLK